MASAFNLSKKDISNGTDEMMAEKTEPETPAKDIESAANDPDFAVICAFLQKFAKDIGLDMPNFNHLHQWLVNTDEVSQKLREMHVKLLRKIRRTVHEKCWEVPLSKFCFSYSAQDAWEVERFGYKKSSLKVKLRILRNLLECQFERNNKFRTKLLTQTADSLRSQPIGRDRLGHNYWLTQDDDCNLRIYQEHLDEEIWRVVATNRDELVNLIACLRGNEVILPSADIGIIDEDTSSSNSCADLIEKPPPPEEQDDSQEEQTALKVPNLRIKLGGANIKTNEQNESKEQTEKDQKKSINLKEKSDRDSVDESPKKVKPLIIQQSQIGVGSPNTSSKRKTSTIEEVSSPESDEPRDLKRPRPSLLDSRRASKPGKYFKPSKEEEVDEEEEEEEYESSSLDGQLDDEEEEGEEEDIDSAAAEEGENEDKFIEYSDDTNDEGENVVGEAVEDPPVHVRGNGAGKECEGVNLTEVAFNYLSLISIGNIENDQQNEQILSEPIEEDILYFYGEGDGLDCLVGNKTEETATTPTENEPKATFFFGEPGCLKLSPIKVPPPSLNTADECDEQNVQAEDLKKEKLLQLNEEEAEKKAVHSKLEVALDINGGEKQEISIGQNSGDKAEENEQKSPNEELKKEIKNLTANLKENTIEKHENKKENDTTDNNSDQTTLEKKVELQVENIKSINEEKNEEKAKEEKKKKERKEAECTKRTKEIKQSCLQALNETSTNEAEKQNVIKMTEKIIHPNQTIHFNRKRRLTDFTNPAPSTPPAPPLPARLSTSESEFDAHSDQLEEITALEDIGGKRLKMRPKCSNVEVRKKIEAQLQEKKHEQEETTSSSGDEEARRPRKMITPKRSFLKTMQTPIETTNTPKRPLPPFADETEARSRQLDTRPVGVTTTTNALSPPPPVMKSNETLDTLKEKEEKSCNSAKMTTPLLKTKPTLSEIIEKKLKKTPPQKSTLVLEDACASTSTSVEKLIFSLPKKSPITKPLKKNLLTQLRESEEDDDAVPRKRTISETLITSPTISSINLVATESKSTPNSKQSVEVEAAKSIPKVENLQATTRNIHEKRATPECQRKRQSSEEAACTNETEIINLQTDNNCNGEANRDSIKKIKESTPEIVKNVKPKSIKKTLPKALIKTEAEPTAVSIAIAEKLETKATDDTISIGRRSSRRCAASVVYAELPQPKRTRGGGGVHTKVMPKKETADKQQETNKKQISVNTKEAESMKIDEKEAQSESKLKKIEANKEKESKSIAKKNEEKPTIDAKTKAVKEEKQNEAIINNKIENQITTCEAENLEDQIKVNVVHKHAAAPAPPAKANDKETIKAKTETSSSKTSGGSVGRKKREVDMLNIIETNDTDETPVRQSRRIAQQKIREEAERRKLEEIALRSMKQELKKKKKAEKEADPTVAEPSSAELSSSSTSESESEQVKKKKKVKKKCPGKDGGWSSGSEEEDEPEEEDEHPQHYETDAGSPLFKSDHEFSPESDIEDETQVIPMKRARTVRKEDGDDDEQCEGQRDGEACQKCGKSDHPEWILLCDKCDKGYHCSCLSPVLFYIPEGNWYCPPCQQEQLIVALEKQLQEFDELVERKRIELEEEKRLAEVAEREEQARLKQEEEQRKERRMQKQKKRKNEKSNGAAELGDEHEEDNDNENDEESDDNNESKRHNLAKDDVEKNLEKSKAKADNKHHKRRRGGEGGRNRRRKAAKRGTRRRRRLNKNSDSETRSDTSSDSRSGSGGSDSGSDSGSTSSDTFSDSDDEPIYKLRKRRQINVSYRLNEYDDLINSALKKEMDEIAGAGNLGRGKDITTIIEADKEEKARLKQLKEEEEEAEKATVVNVGELADDDAQVNDKSANECNEKKISNVQATTANENENTITKLKTKPKLTTTTTKKKSRKLTKLDISSEEDNASDEDFKTSSFDDEEEDEDDTLVSASTDSDTSLEIYRRRKGGKKKQRKVARRAARERRKERRFVVDDSDDDDDDGGRVTKPKKKRKEVSDYSESETDDLSENSENIDSADLCDDTTSDDSDGAWHPSKRKKQRKSLAAQAAARNAAPKPKKPQPKKPKQLEYSDDDISETEEEEEDDEDDIGCGKGSGKQPRSQPLIPVKSNKTNTSANTNTKGKGKGKGNANVSAKKKQKKKQSEDELSFSDDSGDSTRRTRGRRYAYILDFDDDSSDGGIKPGVKRPDTPPEEREKFIKKQEEIKRMLAEKNSEGAKLAATPRLTPIKAMAMAQAEKRSPAKQDSLSTVPLSVIRQAKVLDIDYLQRKGGGSELDNVNEEAVDSEFDDADLPDDLPEDMDEDAIARMVEEEEEFGTAATRELPAPDEILRTPIKSKAKDTGSVVVTLPFSKTGGNASLEALAQMQSGTPTIVPTSAPTAQATTTITSGLQEPTRKRLPMPTLHPPLLRHQYHHPHHPNSPHTQSGNIMLHSLQQHMSRHPPPPTHLLQNALSAPLGQSLNRNFGHPHTAHSVGPPRPPLPARQLLPPNRSSPATAVSTVPISASVTPEVQTKPRGRRKKITPLRDNAQKQATAASTTAANLAEKANSVSAAESSSRPSTLVVSSSAVSSVIKSSTTSTQSPQLYKAPSDVRTVDEQQPSVITRMPHLPPSRMIFQGADVARFYSSLQSHGAAGLLPRHLNSHTQRQHRGPPLQMPPGLGPPSSSLGGSGYGPPHSRHPPPPHLNSYRPPIYGNPSYGQPRPLSHSHTPSNVRLSTPPSSGPEYMPGTRPYPPYGYYPPPPPLTTSHHPPPVSSVIVAAPSSAITTHASLPPSTTSNASTPTVTTRADLTTISREKSSPKEETLHKKNEIAPQRPTPTSTQKKLTTLDVYTTSNAKSPLAIGGGESSGSQPETAEDSPTPAATGTQSQSKAGEFSGLVSYFSSQHDDYNT